jgi:acyl-CoA synthetase (NDP forming)/GNAT superfamily N-acetyltransferase
VDSDTGGWPVAAEPMQPESAGQYPEHWEADVVLRDGGTCHLRPIGPSDGQRLRDFHGRLSAQTIYFRYFAPYPELSDRDVQRFTHVDHDQRVAIVATVGGEIVGIGRYDRVSDTEAEIAFTVRDDHQSRGLGSVLLEHLAAAARERGIDRFVAEVLPANNKMIGTFQRAGYTVAQEMADGVVRLAFDIEPTESARAVARGREQRAEAKSVERLFRPGSVAVIGASRRKDSMGNQLLRSVRDGGFTGRLLAIHPAATEVAGVPAYPTLREAPGPVDLAVVAVPADAVERVIDDAAAAGVHGLIVISAGFAEAGQEGAQRQRELVHKVRGAGMRLVGPNALGVANTDARIRLHALLAKERAMRGRVAIFCQSAAIGTVLLERFRQRDLGLSSFLSVGNRADISSPDALHYWADDPATSVIALYLDGIANPSKAIRVARDVARRTPVVALRAGRVSQAFPLGPLVRRTTLPAHGVQQLFAQAGFIDVDSMERLLDVCGLLSCQPLPQGNRVAVISDSVELAAIASDTAGMFGLQALGEGRILSDTVGQLPAALEAAIADDAVDAILVINSPPGVEPPPDIAEELLAGSARAAVPVLAVLSFGEDRKMLVAPGPDGAAGHGSVPVFGTVEDALHALGLVAGYRRWLATPRGAVPPLPDVDSESARSIIDQALSRQRRHAPEQRRTVRLSNPATASLLQRYGISLWPAHPVASEDEAVAFADRVGWPVALKTLDPRLSRRMESGGVRLNLESEDGLRGAYLSMAAQLDATSMAQLVVQRMAPTGVPCALASVEDPLFGPVVSFSIAGVVPDLLDDKAFRVPPISTLDAAALVRAPRASSLLFGFGGNPPVDVAQLEDLLIRLGRMAEDLPALVRVNLDPVVASPRSVSVLGASVWVRVPDLRIDTEARRLADV